MHKQVTVMMDKMRNNHVKVCFKKAELIYKKLKGYIKNTMLYQDY